MRAQSHGPGKSNQREQEFEEMPRFRDLFAEFPGVVSRVGTAYSSGVYSKDTATTTSTVRAARVRFPLPGNKGGFQEQGQGLQLTRNEFSLGVSIATEKLLLLTISKITRRMSMPGKTDFCQKATCLCTGQRSGARRFYLPRPRSTAPLPTL